MTAIEGVFPLPEAAILKVAEKLSPRVVAHFHGGDLIVAVGAWTAPLALVAFRKSGGTDVRIFPARPFTDEVGQELRARKRAGEFDPEQDWYSRDLAASPRQFVSIGDTLVLVRSRAGHALVDGATLEIDTVPRSAVEQLYLVGPDRLLVGACGKYANDESVQLFWTYDAARIREPLVRYSNKSTRHPEYRIVDGTPFPDEEAPIPLAKGIARLEGKADLNHYSYDDMHVAAAISWRGELFALTLGLNRSISCDHALTRMNFESRKVERFTRLAPDKTLRATFAPTTRGLLAFTDVEVWTIDPETLAVVDRAPLPKGIRLVGSDEERLILHHKRASTLFVVRNTAFSAPLGASLAAVEAEMGDTLKASRAAAKRRQA